MTRTTVITCAMAAVLAATVCAAEPARNAVDDLKPGEWLEVPDSHLDKIGFQWPKGITCTENGVGVTGVISCWSSGAYDTKRNRLIVWGGGHSAYAGNEIYVFDVNKLAWARASDPSLKTDSEGKLEKEGKYEDETPRSSHSYNYIQYVPAIDRFCVISTAAHWPSGQSARNFTWAFDFEAKKWERKADTPAWGIGTYSDVDPVTGHVFARGGNSQALAEWDPVKNVWTTRAGNLSNGTDYAKTGAIDPIGRRFIGIGGREIYKYEIGREVNKVTQDVITTQGPQDAVNASDPGLVYDPVVDKLVAWVGGTDVYTLDLVTLTWEKVAAAASNQVVPSKPCPNGTYGRWRYIPSKNAYIVVNDVKQNVYVYRLTDLGKQPVPKRLAEAAKSADPALAAWAAEQVKRFGSK
jgi:hypothetical protein